MENKVKISNLIKASNYESAMKILNKSYKNNYKEYYYYQALILCGQKKFDKAISYFNLSKNFGMFNYLLYYNLGVACMECHDYINAEKYYKLSMDLNRYYTKNYINTAYIYTQNGDYKKAYRMIKLGLALKFDSELNSIENNLLNLIKTSSKNIT